MLERLRFGKNPYRELEKKLGYGFKKRRNLETALTHRSFRFENRDVETDNQRVEFLGDAVLGFLVGAYLHDKHPERDEGFLTMLRSQVTSGKALAEIGMKLGLGEYLKVGKGEEQSGGRTRPSNIADALEAVLGAAFVDGGIKAVQKIFKKIMIRPVENLSGDVWEGNPKGQLQEVCQRVWRKGPRYSLVSREGPQHAARFTVEVLLPDGTSGKGVAGNKHDAETVAALKALEHVRGSAGR